MKETHSNGKVTFHIQDLRVRMSTKYWLEYIQWNQKAMNTINSILQS